MSGPTMHDVRPPARVTTALGEAPVPRFEHDDAEQTRPGGPARYDRELSPMARLAVLSTQFDPIVASAAVTLLEAYNALDANKKVLLVAIACAFREADRG